MADIEADKKRRGHSQKRSEEREERFLVWIIKSWKSPKAESRSKKKKRKEKKKRD
uniref:Uncharacterized protein n=1 Tax=Cucumis melo TaxID=3656 RepID=A0A9I9D7K6_CUCME